MAAAGPAMEPPSCVGLGLNLAQDADISHFSLRPETKPAALRNRFQATVDDDDSDQDTVVASSPARNKAADSVSSSSSSSSSRTSTQRPHGDCSDHYQPASPTPASRHGKPCSPPSPSPSPSPSSPYSHANTSTSTSKSHTPSSSTAYVTPHATTLTPPSPAESSPKQRPTVHFSTRPPVVLHHRSNSYPAAAEPPSPRYTTSSRGDGGPHMSVVDRQWGQLFTEHGEPTRRLASVLRGLANYMVREYEPRGSLVIPPVKMFALYRRYKLDKEQFPFQGIFDYQSRHCLRSLELLYQDLSCEYHLIQDHHSTRPYIPALTPVGLQTWLTAFIQAAPDSESYRLQSILMDIPLEADHQGSAPAERLPKQLSRHLFPAHRNDRTYRDIVCALDDWSKRMGSSSESPSPSWSNLIFEAFRGASHMSSSPAGMGRRERPYHTDDYKRHISRKSPPEDVTISPANTSRRRQKSTSTASRTPQEAKYYYSSASSSPSSSASQREKVYNPEPRYFPISHSEPSRRRYSEPSPERIKYDRHTSRRRDKSPRLQGPHQSTARGDVDTLHEAIPVLRIQGGKRT
ncbi:hypothetical protein J3459_015030 [Metarhizium acridum]|nr:hypothetical protein J3459_015030 [Metarhizium acridum]